MTFRLTGNFGDTIAPQTLARELQKYSLSNWSTDPRNHGTLVTTPRPSHDAWWDEFPIRCSPITAGRSLDRIGKTEEQ